MKRQLLFYILISFCVLACAKPNQNWHLMQSRALSESTQAYAQETKQATEAANEKANDIKKLQGAMLDISENTAACFDNCEMKVRRLKLK